MEDQPQPPQPPQPDDSSADLGLTLYSLWVGLRIWGMFALVSLAVVIAGLVQGLWWLSGIGLLSLVLFLWLIIR